jgi:hypothetical protein
MIVELGARRAIEAEDCLQQIAFEFKSKLHDPDLITPDLFETTHRIIWQVRGQRNRQSYEVSPCPWTPEQLVEIMFRREGISYMPQGLETQDNRHNLLGIFPYIGSHSVQPGNPVTNIKSPSGWFTYDTSKIAPYGDTDEEDLIKLITTNGGQLLSLNQYIVASYDTKLFLGYFLDEYMSCARLGSCLNDALVVAHFRPDGTDRMDLSWGVKPKDRYPRMGGRSTKSPSSFWIP